MIKVNAADHGYGEMLSAGGAAVVGAFLWIHVRAYPVKKYLDVSPYKYNIDLK